MYGAAGWLYTPGVPGITPPARPKGTAKGRSGGMPRLSGFKTGKRAKEELDNKAFKRGRYDG